jgi:hypothetical protein
MRKDGARVLSWGLVVVCLVAAGAVAAAIVVVFSGGGGGEPGLTKVQYLRRANAICQAAGRKLDRIAPPSDLTAPGNVLASVQRALPVLIAQEASIRTLDPPAVLRPVIKQLFSITDRSIAQLERVGSAAAHPNVPQIILGFQRFLTLQTQAKAIAARVGYHC